MGKPERASHLAAYQFGPGNNANPAGRPKGSRSKLQEAVIRALHQDFEQYGVEAIRRVRERRPEVYLTACVSLLPKQAEKVQSPFSDISDGELEALEQHLAAVRAKMVRDIDATAEPAPAATPEATAAIVDEAVRILDAADVASKYRYTADMAPETTERQDTDATSGENAGEGDRAEHIVDQSTLPDSDAA